MIITTAVRQEIAAKLLSGANSLCLYSGPEPTLDRNI